MTFNNASRPFESAQASDFLATPSQQDVYRIALSVGDRVTAVVDAQNSGSALDGLLRVFDAAGHQVAFNDNFNGRDPQLTFQAATDGDYYLTVAAANATSGRYDLTLSRELGAELAPDLVSSGLSVSQDTVASGDRLTITYTIENRGGAGTDTPFNVNFRLSQDNLITPSDLNVATRTVGPLGAGQSFTETFTVTLPQLNVKQNTFTFNFPGLPAPPPGPAFRLGPVFLGVNVDANDDVFELDETNNAEFRQGTDLDALTFVQVQAEKEPNDSGFNQLFNQSSLFGSARLTGSISPGDFDLIRLKVPDDGLLTIRAHGDGVDTRLSLFVYDNGDRRLLAQSDGTADGADDLIVQHLQVDLLYYLQVSSLDGRTGTYTVTTKFEAASPPGDLIEVGRDPRAIVAADFNGDGITDLATANRFDQSVSILFGRSDGTFQVRTDAFGNAAAIRLDNSAVALATGDFNGDGIADLAVTTLGEFDFDTEEQEPGALVVLLGKGDGTFRTAGNFEVSGSPRAVVTGEFDGDGILDLAVANDGSNSVQVFRGDGTGQFELQGEFDVGGSPTALVAAQFTDDNNDGRIDAGDFLDLAVAVQTDNLPDGSRAGQVVLLRGTGDGPFTTVPGALAVGEAPSALVAAQFNDDNGDGKIDNRDFLDLAVANSAQDFRSDGLTFRGDVSVLFGTGPGTFAPEVRLPAGFSPQGILAGDFNNDGIPDLVTANHDSRNATVLLGQPGGQFAAPLTFAVGAAPFGLAQGDFDGDGRLDLAFVNKGTDEDLNILPDGSVSVLRGRGDGTFSGQVPNAVTATPSAIVTADFNNDNRPDVATGNADGTVSVLLGQGDGTLGAETVFRAGAAPKALAVGDFNRDGRPDLVAANDGANTVSVLLGVGDGSFRAPTPFAVGLAPVDVVVGQFSDDNGDGVINDRDFLDIVTANRDSNDVSLLLGNGDGTFQAAQQVALSTTGAGPVALAAGQFNDDNGDGLIDNRDFLDLATVSPAADSGAELTILLGNGKGTFTPVTGAAPVGVGDVPTDLVVGDFTNDGILDLAIGNASPDDPLADEDILIFAGDGQGHFGLDGVQFVGGIGPGVALAAGDFNGDGLTDLAVATGAQAFDIILLNSADAGLDFGSLFVPGESFALATADFNGDGLDDLVNATTFPNNVLVGLASVQVDPIGGEMFLEFIAGEASSDVRSTPILVDVNGDGLTDSVVVGEDGRVLLRLREANAQGTFAPPILVNPLTLPSPPSDGGEGRVRGRPARAVTAVQVGGETLLAATDQSLNPALGRTGNVITLYRISANGRPSVAGELAISDSSSPDEPARNGSQLSRIVAADLNGDGIEDLAVLDRLNGLPGVSVFLGDGAGGFQIFTDELGQSRDFLQFDLDETGPVDLAAVDVTGDGFVDLVVTDQLSGDVTVLVNGDEGRGPDSVDFGSQVLRFRAGAGPFSIPSGSGPFLLEDPPETVRSQDRPAGVAVADFNSDGIVDVVVADAGTNNFAFLAGRGRGSFANPVVTQLSFSPALVVAGQFNDDNGDKKIDARDNADLAFLNESGETVSIFLGDGHGGFTEKVARDASGNIVPLRSGNSPTGLSVADVNGDGRLDLQVGNAFGDVLTLLGNGDGTFQPARRANSDVLLATGDFNGDGVADALVANAARDQVSVQLRVAGTNTFTQGSLVGTADTGLQAPVAPVLADLNGDGRADTIVANSGGNTVTVFLAQADGSVVTRSFFAGTSPAGIAVRDLNGDSIPDLIVANQGSNDVSILFGQGQGDSYTLTSGPRIRAGNGPISADVVADFNGDNIADLMVVNGQDGTVSFVPGRGKGFFDDTAAQVRALKDPASGGTPVIDVSVDGFLVTDSGAILNAATGGTVFFDATRQARAIDTVTLAGGVGLVVAFGDGSLSLLTADANGNFSQSQVLADTGLVDPSAVQILGDGERLEAYVTEAGDSVPFVFAFDLTAAANGTGPGGEAVASGATGSADEASVVSVSQTQVSDSTLNFVATLLGSGPLDATLSAVQGPSGTEASVAPDVVLGIGDVLDNSASRSGSTEGSELPVEVWLPYLIERVAQLAPNLTESIASTEQGLSEAIAQATALAAGPLGLALEALQVKDIPLVEPGLVGLAGEIGTELVGVGRDLAARFALQSREQLKVETPAPQEPLPVNTTRPEARAEAPVPVQDTAVDQKAQDGEGSSLEEASFSGESSEPDAVAVEEMFQRDKLLVALLTTAVFASGFSHRRQRDTRKQAPRLENVRRPAKSTR